MGMRRISGWRQFRNEGFDLWSGLNNFIQHGLWSLGKGFEKHRGRLVAEIEEMMDQRWFEYDVEFLRGGVKIHNPATGQVISLDWREGSVAFGRDVVYFPCKEVRDLCDRLHAMRQEKMTVPGVRLDNPSGVR
jgi:hypothetical protein